jgi:hypothetical protein
MTDVSRIRAYYDETWLDYRMLWLNPRNRAIHFGYCVNLGNKLMISW